MSLFKQNLQYIQVKVKGTQHEKFFANTPDVFYRIKLSLHVNNLVKILPKSMATRKERTLFKILCNEKFLKPLRTKMAERKKFSRTSVTRGLEIK